MTIIGDASVIVTVPLSFLTPELSHGLTTELIVNPAELSLLIKMLLAVALNAVRYVIFVSSASSPVPSLPIPLLAARTAWSAVISTVAPSSVIEPLDAFKATV